MSKGYFAILFPGDLHAPGLAAKTESENVKKIVIKVPVDH
jgi:beta-galactosidase beta subunit